MRLRVPDLGERSRSGMHGHDAPESIEGNEYDRVLHRDSSLAVIAKNKKGDNFVACDTWQSLVNPYHTPS
jgi:hypothetical protein